MNMNEYDDEIPDIDVSDIVIPGVDAEVGSSLYGGEMDIYLSVLRSFVGSIPAAVEKLRTVSAETLPQYATVVHGLKGSCASIAAEEVREKAYDLEKKAKAGDLGGVLAQNEALLKETEQLIKDIQVWLDGLN
jgi:HPt (histidine-containing phosphotransfer) domain-containing protein